MCDSNWHKFYIYTYKLRIDSFVDGLYCTLYLHSRNSINVFVFFIHLIWNEFIARFHRTKFPVRLDDLIGNRDRWNENVETIISTSSSSRKINSVHSVMQRNRTINFGSIADYRLLKLDTHKHSSWWSEVRGWRTLFALCIYMNCVGVLYIVLFRFSSVW